MRVRAAGVCRGDLMQRDGLYPPPSGTTPPELPGLELAGEVVRSATVCTATGRRPVMAVVTGAGRPSWPWCPRWWRSRSRTASRGPSRWLPRNYTTAHDALFSQCGLATGERVCVHGAAGGVGTAAVELAVAAGCDVVATVRNEAARAGVTALGATAVAPEGFGDHGPFDVVLELVGADNMPANLRALATGGRIAVIGVGAGFKAEVNLLALMGARGGHHGSTCGPRTLEDKADAASIERKYYLWDAARHGADRGKERWRTRRMLRAVRRRRQVGKIV